MQKNVPSYRQEKHEKLGREIDNSFKFHGHHWLDTNNALIKCSVIRLHYQHLALLRRLSLDPIAVSNQECGLVTTGRERYRH